MKICKLNKTSNNHRLAEMGFIKDSMFRIIKRVAGMIQIRLKGSDIVIREELERDIDYDK